MIMRIRDILKLIDDGDKVVLNGPGELLLEGSKESIEAMVSKETLEMECYGISVENKAIVLWARLRDMTHGYISDIPKDELLAMRERAELRGVLETDVQNRAAASLLTGRSF